MTVKEKDASMNSIRSVWRWLSIPSSRPSSQEMVYLTFEHLTHAKPYYCYLSYCIIQLRYM